MLISGRTAGLESGRLCVRLGRDVIPAAGAAVIEGIEDEAFFGGVPAKRI